MVFGVEHIIPSQTIAIGRESLTGLECENVNIINSSSVSSRRRSSSSVTSTTIPPSELIGLTREERRRRRRATLKYRTAHATRERIRVEAFNMAFSDLRKLLPTLPPDKKLSKIEILKLAICYIAYLNHVLDA